MDPPKPPSRSTIYLQDACYQHYYIRSKDDSNIVERPERLRALTLGLAGAIARVEESSRPSTNEHAASTPHEVNLEIQEPEGLVSALERLNLTQGTIPLPNEGDHITIVQSHATIDLINHPAVKFIHGDIDGDVYLENLRRWAGESWNKVKNGESEIPEGLSQGDLYLCPQSIDAIQGAIGTVCEAVDQVVTSTRGGDQASPSSTPMPLPSQRAFVAIRPPGHHCGEDTPSGFCFINNVAVAAAHAHLKHKINRIVILDIDLHHGNGTQSIVWQINEETYRQTLESDGSPGDQTSQKPGLSIFYGSIHDILSYPCEDGKPSLVQAASVSLHRSHGQYIENVHLETYNSDQHFWGELYKEKYSRVLVRAEEFLRETDVGADDALIFISCGMDACEHEHASMSRHNRKVPTSFYHRFALDTCALSDRYASGRVVSVLEGGYSDRALISGGMAHLVGLAGVRSSGLEDEKEGSTRAAGHVEEWWGADNLDKLEKVLKRRKTGTSSTRQSLAPSITDSNSEQWLERASSVFHKLTESVPKPQAPKGSLVPPSTRTLRDRKKAVSPGQSGTPEHRTNVNSPKNQKGTSGAAENPFLESSSSKPKKKKSAITPSPAVKDRVGSNSDSSEATEAPQERKLPRVILKLGQPPTL